MKVLVIGSGGREHAVIRKLKENKEIDTIWCAPGNGGISADAVCVDIKAMDKEALPSVSTKGAELLSGEDSGTSGSQFSQMPPRYMGDKPSFKKSDF